MTIELLVPALGESVVEATVAKWMKSSGDTINADEPIVELETEKVTLEVPSPISGVLKEIVANEGDNVEVGALLGVISDSLNDVQPPNNSNQEKKLEENSSNTHTNTEKKNSHLSPAVKRIVGAEGEMGAALGLDNDWSLRIIKQVGNYGESYKRNIADTGILPDRGPNEIWTNGGLLYTPPAR